MRTFSVSLLLLVVTSLFLVSCSDDEEPEPTQPTVPAQFGSGAGGGIGSGGSGGGSARGDGSGTGKGAGTGGGSGQQAQGEGTGGTSNPVYQIEIFVNDRPNTTVDLSEIENLPRIEIMGEPNESGPAIESVLESKGIDHYRFIQVVGLGPGRTNSAEFRIERVDVTDTMILDITGRGTVKFAGEDIPRNEWILDVQRIYVEQGLGEEPAVDYSFVIVHRGDEIRTLVPDDLRDLETVDLPVVGVQTGPTLRVVLEFVGIDEFDEVVITGLTPGRRGESSKTLLSSEVDETVILDFTGRGTVKLASTSFHRDQWVIDVAKIEVD